MLKEALEDRPFFEVPAGLGAAFSSALAEAVFSLIVSYSRNLPFSREFTRIINQFDHCHFGVVANAASKFDNTSITPVAVFVTRAKLVKEPLDRFYAGRSLDLFFRLALLTAKTALLDLEIPVSGVKESGRLPAKMHSAENGIVTFQHLRLSGQGYGLLNERAQFLGLMNGRYDVFLFGVYQRGRQVPEQRDTMLGRSSQFTMCF
jgi:hypothetical protein